MAGTANRQELAGFTVGVTAQRRAAEFVALLARHGAIPVHAPTIRIVHLLGDDQLLSATRSLIDRPADILVVTTGFGFRGWVDAAHAWGLTDELYATLHTMRIVARGPKALGAVRQAGLHEQWSARSESSAEVVDRLADEAARGARIAVQLHGAGSELEPNADVCRPLAAAGADVVAIPVYRWQPPDDLRPMDRLIRTVLDGGLDAVAFTSAPAAVSLVNRAKTLAVLPDLNDALGRDTLVACVGPVTAAPLQRLGVPTVLPTRNRLGALARLLLEELPRRAVHAQAAGHQLSLRRTGVFVDGRWRPVSPVGMSVLRELITRQGHAATPSELELDAGNAHTTVMRLRASLDAPACIETVSKQGYRLALDRPPHLGPRTD